MKFLYLLACLLMACVLMAPLARAIPFTVSTAPPTPATGGSGGNDNGGPGEVASTPNTPPVNTDVPLYGTRVFNRNYRAEVVY